MSQTEFGLAAGVGRKTQFNYETDTRSPDAEYLQKVAMLGVDIRYVVTGYRDYQAQPPLTAEEETALALWRKATSETRRAALGALVGATPADAPRVVVSGKVETQINGDQTVHGDLNIGGKRKR